MAKRAKGDPGADKPRSDAAKSPADDRPPLTQREKFIQTAREIGADETGEALDEALRTIGRARSRTRTDRPTKRSTSKS